MLDRSYVNSLGTLYAYLCHSPELMKTGKSKIKLGVGKKTGKNSTMDYIISWQRKIFQKKNP